MEYICILKDGSRRETWTGELHLLRGASGQYEAEISGRGTYFHILAGRHRYGNYLCIPNHMMWAVNSPVFLTSSGMKSGSAI